MPVTRTRYRANNHSFGEFMRSEQARQPAVEAAREIAAIATGRQKVSKAPYTVSTHAPDVVIEGNPRAIAQIEGDDPLHAVEEFGSGTHSAGKTAGQPREQGGWSDPRRTLAISASMVLPNAIRPPK